MELALLSPVLLMLLAGTADVIGHIRATLRLETASATVAQGIAQCSRLGSAAGHFSAAQSTLGGLLNLSANQGGGAMILSAIQMSGGTPTVTWQVRQGDAGQRSVIGVPGGRATLTDGMTVPAGQTLLAVEVYGQPTSFVLSQGFMRSMFGPLSGVSVFASRWADPVRGAGTGDEASCGS